MKDFYYLDEPESISGSDLLIVAIKRDGSPYALRKRDHSRVELYDLENSFSLMPYLTRLAEAGEDVPDYGKVQEAIKVFKERVAKALKGAM